MDEKYEPIEAALRAYASRLAAQEGLPDKLKLYPNPREEKLRLDEGRQLIKDTQTMIEGPMPRVLKGPIQLMRWAIYHIRVLLVYLFTECGREPSRVDRDELLRDA